jgi:phosphohistidine phosphatase
MIDILLMRHGKSDKTVDVNAFHRPLQTSGKRAAQRMGFWLHQHGYQPNRVWSSPAIRAIETTEKMVKAMGLGVSIIDPIDSLYDANTATILNILSQARKSGGMTLIVGHNPAIEMALSIIVPEQISKLDDDNLIPTGALAHLHFDKQEKATLKQIIVPKSLPEFFSIETKKGTMLVERPPYYYHQSGVIPFRLFENQWQVLLITKPYKSKWGLAKGIIEPGLTAIESAEKEAMEEAGAIGDVVHKPLGRFQHDKWGGTCDVVIYPMQVNSLLDDGEWESNKRSRRWFSFAEAKQQIQNQQIRLLFESLEQRLGKPE